MEKYQIQKQISIILITATMAAIITNVMAVFLPSRIYPISQYITNIAVFSSATIFLFLISLVNSNKARFIQCLVILSGGIFLLIRNSIQSIEYGVHDQSYSGEIFIIISLSLFAVFNIFKIRKSFYYYIFAIIVIITTQLIIAIIKNELTLNLFTSFIISSVIIAFIYTLLFYQIKFLETEKRQNQLFIRLGKNLGTILHNIKHLSIANSHNYYALKYLENGNYDKVKKLLIEQKKFLKKFSNQTNDLAKIMNLNSLPEPEKVDFNQLVRTSFEYAKSSWPDKAKTIEYDINLHPEPLIINVVPFEIIKSLENILNNAIEAMLSNESEKKHKLSIITEQKANNIILTISDTGGGIPGISGQVNLEYFKLGKTTKENGSGFGLSYAKEHIKQNKGILNIYSTNNGLTIKNIF